jgi:hypothetical protein
MNSQKQVLELPLIRDIRRELAQRTEQNNVFVRRANENGGLRDQACRPPYNFTGTRLLRSRIEPLLCLTGLFMSLLKVLICGPVQGSQFWATLYSQSQAHPLIRGCCPREVAHNLKGTLSGPYRLDRNGCGTELIRKLPEPLRCNLIEAEPKLSRTLIWLT